MNMGKETNVNKSRRVAFDNNIEPVDDECRICFESLVDDRTPVKLRCGHQYHLDCIGSAFNAKNRMECPTCKRVEHGQWLFARSSPSPDFNVQPLMGGLPAVEHGQWLFARSSPSPDFNVSLVQPLMGGLPTPVWRESMLTSVERQLGRILPNPARSTSFARFNVPRRESSVELTQQQQIAENISRTLAANDHSIHHTMYGYDIRSSDGVGGSYSRGRGSSTGGESIARFNVPRRESSVELTQQQQIAENISRTLAANEHRIRRTMYGYDIRSSGGEDRSYSRGRGSSTGGGSSAEGMATGELATMMKTIATTSGGETSRSGGSKQFRSMT